jgi:excisionase family DNA binding protein
MESLDMLLSKPISDLANVMAGAMRKNVAAEMDELCEKICRMFYDMYIRPGQEATVMRKADVAKRLNVSGSTVTQMIDSNALKSTKDGRVTEYHLWQYLTDDGKNLSVSPKPPNQTN